MQPLAWEQRKFRTLVRADKNKNKDGLPLPSYSISNQYGFISQDKKFGQDNTYSKADKKNNYIVYPNSFAYNPARINVGSIGYQNLKGPVLVSSLYEIFKTNEQINDLFLQEWFNTKMFFNQIIKYQEGGVRQYYFFDKLQTSEIRLPLNTNEQQGIADLLKKLDNLISLQQRKLDLLKQLKKGLLQKMFADKDAKQPVLRFDGFSGDWEQRKGSELFKSKSDKGYSYLPVLSATQDQGMILREKTGIDIKYKKDSLDNYKRIEPGDFIIHLRSFQGGFAYSSIEGIASPAYTIFSFKEPDEYNDNFWKEKFSSHNFIQLLKKVTYGVRDGRSISYGDFLTLKEQFPNLQEQTKIGKLFTILDKTIPLQQSRLTKLTLLKRFLLQQMFI